MEGGLLEDWGQAMAGEGLMCFEDGRVFHSRGNLLAGRLHPASIIFSWFWPVWRMLQSLDQDPTWQLALLMGPIKQRSMLEFPANAAQGLH